MEQHHQQQQQQQQAPAPPSLVTGQSGHLSGTRRLSGLIHSNGTGPKSTADAVKDTILLNGTSGNPANPLAVYGSTGTSGTGGNNNTSHHHHAAHPHHPSTLNSMMNAAAMAMAASYGQHHHHGHQQQLMSQHAASWNPMAFWNN